MGNWGAGGGLVKIGGGGWGGLRGRRWGFVNELVN